MFTHRFQALPLHDTFLLTDLFPFKSVIVSVQSKLLCGVWFAERKASKFCCLPKIVPCQPSDPPCNFAVDHCSAPLLPSLQLHGPLSSAWVLRGSPLFPFSPFLPSPRLSLVCNQIKQWHQPQWRRAPLLESCPSRICTQISSFAPAVAGSCWDLMCQQPVLISVPCSFYLN